MAKDSIFSTSVKSGGMIFIDVKEAKNGKKYLNITQLGKDASGQDKRNSIFVFNDAVTQFVNSVREASLRIDGAETTQKQSDGLPF